MKGLEVGIQVHLPTHATTTLPELKELARRLSGEGVEQLWFTDNLGSRSLLVVLAALAPVPIRLGAAVMVQYFRSPLEAAAALASVTELTEGRELSVGLGRGNFATAGAVGMPRAIGFLRETARALSALWSGGALVADEALLLADYFHLAPGTSLSLAFSPAAPIRLYGGGSGPLSIKAARELMDGMLLNGTMFLPALRLGWLEAMVRSSRASRGAEAGFRRVADLKVAVHEDRRVAREFARRSVGQRMVSLRRSGLSDEDFSALGVDPGSVDELAGALAAGRRPGEVSSLVSDAMVDAVFVAGDPLECRERLENVAAASSRLGIDQLMFSEIGPEPMPVALLLDKVVS